MISSGYKGPALLAGLVLLLLSMAFSCTLGAVDISAGDVLRMTLHTFPGLGPFIHPTWSEGAQMIILGIRLPRVVLGAIIGGGLATAGTAYQALFRNPMADPYVIGVSSGASLGAAAAITLGVGASVFGAYAVPAAAFVGGLITVMAVYRIAARGNRVGTNELLLSGVAISSFASALVSLLMVLSTKQLDKVVMWLLGSLSSRGWEDTWICGAYTAVGFLVVFLLSKQLNALLLGNESASHLGVDVDRLKIWLLAAGSLMAASAVAVSGVIGFVGLIIPHITRLVLGPDHRYLVPGSALLGGIFLVLSDAVARTIIAPVELPVGVVTAIFGAPFFLYLLKTSHRGI